MVHFSDYQYTYLYIFSVLNLHCSDLTKKVAVFAYRETETDGFCTYLYMGVEEMSIVDMNLPLVFDSPGSGIV